MSNGTIMVTNAASGITNSKEIPWLGATLNDFIQHHGMESNGVIFRLNNQPASPDTVLQEGSRLTISRTDLKGAADESISATDLEALKSATLEDLTKAGAVDVKKALGNAVLGEILTEQNEARQEKFKGVFATEYAQLTSLSKSANAEIDRLERALASAQRERARIDYAANQLVQHNNIFAVLALTGRKHEAERICGQIGVKVPGPKANVWKLSDKEEDSAEAAE